MIYAIDLDSTLCSSTKSKTYEDCQPIINRIQYINELHEQGNYIKIYTARGMTRHNGDVAKAYDDLYILTKTQLKKWNIRYDILIMGKPSYDVIIDDKAINDNDFFKRQIIKGIIAGSFDILHPGYIKMFNYARKHCGYLIVALHIDPSEERPTKHTPILSVEDRFNALMSLKSIDEVYTYSNENDLYELLVQIDADVRFVGDDYIDKDFTGKNLTKDIIYIDRSHGWSTTKFKQLIYDSKN